MRLLQSQKYPNTFCSSQVWYRGGTSLKLKKKQSVKSLTPLPSRLTQKQMRIGSMQLKNGAKLLATLATLALSSCRSDQPPNIEICIIGEGGGAACVLKDGTRKYRPPSEMVNYWATNQPDMSTFSAWCYDTSLKNVEMEMLKSMAKARGEYIRDASIDGP
jgi:hypothetical protein